MCMYFFLIFNKRYLNIATALKQASLVLTFLLGFVVVWQFTESLVLSGISWLSTVYGRVCITLVVFKLFYKAQHANRNTILVKCPLVVMRSSYQQASSECEDHGFHSTSVFHSVYVTDYIYCKGGPTRSLLGHSFWLPSGLRFFGCFPNNSFH